MNGKGRAQGVHPRLRPYALSQRLCLGVVKENMKTAQMAIARV